MIAYQRISAKGAFGMIDCQNEFGAGGLIDVVTGKGGLPKAVLRHSSGSCAEIYLHGAHITKWYIPKFGDVLFVSKESFFEPNKPIRGGIPVCFPQFGSSGPLPQHGFARTSDWELAGRDRLENGAIAIDFRLKDDEETLSLWPFPFCLDLRAVLEEETLTVTLGVRNRGQQAFKFQVALHTYFSISDIHQTSVAGLREVRYSDALSEGALFTESASLIRFDREIDRVYIEAPDKVEVLDEGNHRKVMIAKQNMPDIVVWNPWTAKSQRMVDFGDDEYLQMVCVETGVIARSAELNPGEHWNGTTAFSLTTF